MKKTLLLFLIASTFNSFGQSNTRLSDIRIGLSNQSILAIDNGDFKHQDLVYNPPIMPYFSIKGTSSQKYSNAIGGSASATMDNGSALSVDLLFARQKQLFKQDETTYTNTDTLFNVAYIQKRAECHLLYNWLIIERMRTKHYFTGGVFLYSTISQTTNWTAKPFEAAEIEDYHIYTSKVSSFGFGFNLGFSSEIILTDYLNLTIRPQYTYFFDRQKEIEAYKFPPNQIRLHIGLSYLI